MQTQTAGPDYVALIIEWDEDSEPTLVIEPGLRVPRALLQVAGAALAGIGALALAAWGIHRRLRAAPAM